MSIQKVQSLMSVFLRNALRENKLIRARKSIQSLPIDEAYQHILQNMTPIHLQVILHQLSEAGMITNDWRTVPYPLESLSILDATCGSGFLTEALAKKGGFLIGIEENADLMKSAQDRLAFQPSLRSNISYRKMPLDMLSIQNKNRFDVVIVSETYSSEEKQERSTHNALECLRPGGSAIFMGINSTWWMQFYYNYLCENVFKCFPKGFQNYKQPLQMDDVIKLLRKRNCITSNIVGFTVNPLTGNWIQIGVPHFNFALHAIKQQSTY